MTRVFGAAADLLRENPSANVLEDLDAASCKRVRGVIVSAVLASCMTRHFAQVAQARFARYPFHGVPHTAVEDAGSHHNGARVN